MGRRHAGVALEWLFIVALAYVYAGPTLLDFDATGLTQLGEHNESATLPLLAEIGLRRHGEVPLWNPFMLTGFPLAGDFMSHFWHPVATLPVALWGGINGMKVSVWLAYVAAGLGQWLFGYVLGLGRTFRLWSAALFMMSGGLALLWRVGWYELLLGAAWFPWCFALYWRAVDRGTAGWITVAGGSIFMVVSAGGGYWPIYLLLCLTTLTIFRLAVPPPSGRRAVLRTAMLVLVFSAALCAIVIVPYVDTLRHATRTVPPDVVQYSAQSIPYGLINFIVYTPGWRSTDILGTSLGWNWFYIGWVPIAALAFVPLALSRPGAHRVAVAATASLFLVLMTWFANRHAPIRQIYDAFPVLYSLRFPNRLLIIATSPLLTLAALALQCAFRLSTQALEQRRLRVPLTRSRTVAVGASRPVVVMGLAGLIATTSDVYTVNRAFAFSNHTLNSQANNALRWLKRQDGSLYYIDLNGYAILWDWLPAAYDLEMPVINFLYSRRLDSQTRLSDDDRWSAQAKYLIYRADRQPEIAAELRRLRNFDDIVVWVAPDALPYAFSAAPEVVAPTERPGRQHVQPIDVRLDGPNRIVARGAPRSNDELLVVMASHYPGWFLSIDGQAAAIEAVHGYLGTRMVPGEHTYVFEFRPRLHIIGAAVSGVAVMVLGSLAAVALMRHRRRTDGKS